MYVDTCLTFSLSPLRESLHDDFSEGIVSWSSGERIRYAHRSLSDSEKVLLLTFSKDGNQVEQFIPLEAVPSNLGIGQRWYMICPYTRRRCTKLILPSWEREFAHRSAWDLTYKKQNRSKYERKLDNTFGRLFDLEDLYNQLRQPKRRTHTRGKPTPLVRKIQKAEAAIKKSGLLNRIAGGAF